MKNKEYIINPSALSYLCNHCAYLKQNYDLQNQTISAGITSTLDGIEKNYFLGNSKKIDSNIDEGTTIDPYNNTFFSKVLFDKKNTRLRVATKYPNLTNNFLVSKGVTQYKLVASLGATETYPFIGSSEIISDITSTGKTLKDNNLRILKDGLILKSQACVLFSKKKAAKLQPFLNSLT